MINFTAAETNCIAERSLERDHFPYITNISPPSNFLCCNLLSYFNMHRGLKANSIISTEYPWTLKGSK